MKDHITQSLYVMLGLVVLIFVITTSMVIVNVSKKWSIEADSRMLTEVDRVERNTLSELEFSGSMIEVPFSVIKAIYFESGSLTRDMYDLTHLDDDIVTTNIDDTDTELNDLGERTLEFINNIESYRKVKLGVVNSPKQRGVYDVYIHDFRCIGEKDHKDTCKKNEANKDQEWVK